MPDTKFMSMAIEKALEGVRQGQSPFGACIVREDEVISCVHNVVWSGNDITAHAEVHAIREACRKLHDIDLSGCTIYSTCEPCPMCFSACHWAKISTVVFGARIADAEKAGFSELAISNETMKELGHSPLRIVAEFMRAESQQVFAEWARMDSKKVY